MLQSRPSGPHRGCRIRNKREKRGIVRNFSILLWCRVGLSWLEHPISEREVLTSTLSGSINHYFVRSEGESKMKTRVLFRVALRLTSAGPSSLRTHSHCITSTHRISPSCMHVEVLIGKPLGSNIFRKFLVLILHFCKL